VVHPIHVSGLSAGPQGPIRPVMDSRCLSAGGIRFLDHPFPAEEFGLPCGRLTGRMSFARRNSIRLRRGYYVSHPREPTGVGVPFTAGAWCPIVRSWRSWRLSQPTS